MQDGIGICFIIIVTVIENLCTSGEGAFYKYVHRD
ncbi:hypothetical protein M758_2G190900 [Ceratodon purpureus]|uniref:Uncharacterized protein n=1 Tax=Ceratodon purpureus TaxID=3225 RepID=A0A8T0IRS4_CERPU|nr:hypothetical protein KC19_2G034900 [Ceratodon purpureus]KAG0627309.1 hypothetical protein M758_2G190900 [Ceratodon purpureus]